MRGIGMALWRVSLLCCLCVSLCVGPALAALVVVNDTDSSVERYDSTTGAFVDVMVPSLSHGLSLPTGVLFGRDRNLYVASYATDEVLRYNGTTGAFIDAFVSVGSGGLSEPKGMVFGPDGNLYVVSGANDLVLKYDGTTGASLGTFVGAAHLVNATDLVFDSSGNLYVCDLRGFVVKFDSTGAFISNLVTPGVGGGGLDAPYGITIGPDGNLYVSSYDGDDIRKFDPTTGTRLGTFPSGGALDGPLGITFGPDGKLYIANWRNHSVERLTISTGVYDNFVASGSGGLSLPYDLAFSPANVVPVANAGPDQSVVAGLLVALDGSASSDEDGDPLTYSWTQAGGPSVSLDLTDPVHPRFTAPMVGPSGDVLQFKLIVNDGYVDSTPDYVSITVSPAQPPVANAGPDQIVPGGMFQLDGSGSYDPQGLPLTYLWLEGVTEITDVPQPWLELPHGKHTLTLKVTNSLGLSGTDDVDVLVDAAPWANDDGIAATAGVGKPITLLGGDPDGDPITFVVLTSPSHGTLSGTAPDLIYTATPGYIGTDSFTFKTNDGWLDSNIATVSISVVEAKPPVADAGTDQIVPTGPVTLNGSASSDPQHQPLFYKWTEGPNVLYNGPDPTTVVPLSHGFHTITLTVTNMIPLSDTDSVNILVDRRPNAQGQQVFTNTDVAKQITLVATDPDDDWLVYHIVTPPAHGTLSGMAPLMFYTPAPGYTGTDSFTFKVDDGWLDSNVATVNINIGLGLGINCGGPAVGTWKKDQSFTGGRAVLTSAWITNTGTVPQTVYKTQRTGSFYYTLRVPNATYNVRLHFAEIEFNRPRARLFDVYIGNTRVLNNFDIYTAAGGMNKAVTREFAATATRNTGLTIRFVPRTLNAIVAGIEVL